MPNDHRKNLVDQLDREGLAFPEIKYIDLIPIMAVNSYG